MNVVKRLLLIFTFVFVAFAMEAQSDSTAVSDPEPVKIERVDGIWSVLGYMGGKLGKQLKTRLNIDEGEKETEPTKVKIRLAGIEIERIENRPKQ